MFPSPCGDKLQSFEEKVNAYREKYPSPCGDKLQ